MALLSLRTTTTVRFQSAVAQRPLRRSFLHVSKSTQEGAAPVDTVIEAGVYPAPETEKEVAHEAFMHAYQASKPTALQVDGLQDFAASVWERRRRIPSQTYNDPLDHVFTEFDLDNDGKLTAAEIAYALQSRNVDVTPEQVQIFIAASDTNGNSCIDRHEFPEFIFHMAVADLQSRGLPAGKWDQRKPPPKSS